METLIRLITTDMQGAEMLGMNSVKNVFNATFEAAKHNIHAMACLALAMNERCWDAYEHDKLLAELYQSLQDQVCHYVYDGNHYTSKEVNFFYQATD